MSMNYDLEPIEVYTPYTFEQMKDFQRYHMRYMRYITIGMAAFMLLWMAINFSAFYTAEAPVITIIQSFSGIIIFFLLMGMGTSGCLYTKKRHEAAIGLLRNGQTYSFRNSEYDAESRHWESTGKFTYSYSVLYRVGETKNMFYLYTNKNMATLIDKQGFHNGTPEELRLLLRKHLPANRYKFSWR